MDGADSFEVDNANPAQGLTSLQLCGNEQSGVNPDDSSGDTFNIVAFGGGVALNVDGQGGSDTLVGPDGINQWAITGSAGGSVTGGAAFNFQNSEILVGGTDDDTFDLQAGGSASSIAGNGQSTVDVITYATRATAVAVNLETDSATDVAAFTGIESLVGSTAGTMQIFPVPPLAR